MNKQKLTQDFIELLNRYQNYRQIVDIMNATEPEYKAQLQVIKKYMIITGDSIGKLKPRLRLNKDVVLSLPDDIIDSLTFTISDFLEDKLFMYIQRKTKYKHVDGLDIDYAIKTCRERAKLKDQRETALVHFALYKGYVQYIYNTSRDVFRDLALLYFGIVPITQNESLSKNASK